MSSLYKAVFILLAAIGVTACGPSYDHTEISGAVTSQLGGSINYDRVSIVEGGVLKIHVASYDDDKKVLANYVTSKDTSVMDALSVVSDHDFAFLGVSPGTTTVEIKAGDDTVLVIQAVVIPQD